MLSHPAEKIGQIGSEEILQATVGITTLKTKYSIYLFKVTILNNVKYELMWKSWCKGVENGKDALLSFSVFLMLKSSTFCGRFFRLEISYIWGELLYHQIRWLIGELEQNERAITKFYKKCYLLEWENGALLLLLACSFWLHWVVMPLTGTAR